jgi:hypothetical protein
MCQKIGIQDRNQIWVLDSKCKGPLIASFFPILDLYHVFPEK